MFCEFMDREHVYKMNMSWKRVQETGTFCTYKAPVIEAWASRGEICAWGTVPSKTPQPHRKTESQCIKRVGWGRGYRYLEPVF